MNNFSPPCDVGVYLFYTTARPRECKNKWWLNLAYENTARSIRTSRTALDIYIYINKYNRHYHCLQYIYHHTSYQITLFDLGLRYAYFLPDAKLQSRLEILQPIHHRVRDSFIQEKKFTRIAENKPATSNIAEHLEPMTISLRKACLAFFEIVLIFLSRSHYFHSYR